MTFLEGFTLTKTSVAERLGISPLEADVAITKLRRAGLLERDSEGRLVKCKRNILLRTPGRSKAFATYLRNMSELALAAMDAQPTSERLFTSQTVCLDETTLAQAKAMIRDCIQRLAGLFEASVGAANTYQVNVQLFNLTDGRLKPTP
jgi:uncharacterized protein (TIGR02147 family)